MSDKPEPTAEHIDAVARETLGYRYTSARVLQSTDPAVHAALAANLPTDAMLTALVERGALSEEWALRYERDGDPTMDNPSGVVTQTSVVASRAIAEQAVTNRVPGGGVRNRRAESRLVTPWEPTP